MPLSIPQFRHAPQQSRTSNTTRFSDEVLARYPGRGEFFIAQLPQFSQMVIDNVLLDPKVSKNGASRRIWHAMEFPKTFSRGISQIRLCAWLASTTVEQIQKYADFLSSPKDDSYSVECVMGAKRMVIAEARFRGIWIEVSRTLSTGARVSNPLMVPELAEQVKSNIATTLVERQPRIDLFAKRLSRQVARVTTGRCRLVLMDNDLEVSEAATLIRQFIEGHVRTRGSWDGMRIQFPHRPNGTYRDDAWAYFVVLVRFLREKEFGREYLELLAEDLSSIRKEQPENIESRSLSRAMAKVIRTELSGQGGDIVYTEYPEVEKQEVPAIPEAAQANQGTAEPATNEPSPAVTVPEPQSILMVPAVYPVRKERKVQTPEPDTIAYGKYDPDRLPRTRLRLQKEQEGPVVELLNRVIELTKNGDRPVPMKSLPIETRDELVWLMNSRGVDLNVGGELVSRSTGMRFVVDRSGPASMVWAWSPGTHSA